MLAAIFLAQPSRRILKGDLISVVGRCRWIVQRFALDARVLFERFESTCQAKIENYRSIGTRKRPALMILISDGVE